MPTNNNRIITYSIYLITNELDGRNYVGKHACKIGELPESRQYMGSGKILKIDQKKLGMKNFSKEVLAICYDSNEINILEKSYIELYRSIGKAEYNIADGGTGGFLGEEWRQSISKSMKALHNSPRGKIVRQKIREKRKLQPPMSKESMERKIKSNKEFWNSPEGIRQKQINSEKQKGSHTTKGKHWYNNGTKNVQAFECPPGFVPGRLGNFTQSEEAKQKKRDWYNNLTEEQRKEYKQHLSESHLGKQFTEERKRHISEAKKGKPGREQTEDIRNKISDGMKGKKRFTDGKTEVRDYECPEGFVPGTLKGYLKKHQDSNINNNKE